MFKKSGSILQVMTLGNKVNQLLLWSGITMMTLLGCVVPQYSSFYRSEDSPRPKEAMKVLGVQGSEKLQYLPDGYVTSRSNYHTLKLMTGVYGGEADIVKAGRGFTPKGSYSISSLSYFDDVCRDADLNKDKIITYREVQALLEEKSD